MQATHRIFVTGATGNVGAATLRALAQAPENGPVVAGVRHPDRVADPLPSVAYVPFDFERPATWRTALTPGTTLFLLRPPQLGDVKRTFAPFVAAAARVAIRHVVFLSVQGVEAQPLVPHHRLERVIRQSGLPYTFLRPAYFMQNFTDTLRDDVVRGEICLPAGNARFTLVDVDDVGRVAAQVLRTPEPYAQRTPDVTGSEQLTFHQMADAFSRELGRPVRYRPAAPLPFLVNKVRRGAPLPLAAVMTALHYLPRFQRHVPPLSDTVARVTGQPPVTFGEFVRRERDAWQGQPRPQNDAPAAPGSGAEAATDADRTS